MIIFLSIWSFLLTLAFLYVAIRQSLFEKEVLKFANKLKASVDTFPGSIIKIMGLSLLAAVVINKLTNKNEPTE